jgi:hypothetical protein
MNTQGFFLLPAKVTEAIYRSTIAMSLDPSNMDKNIIWSLYDCTKVIRLDGCSFEGVVKGELLCAIHRDANNQIYPMT